MNEGGGKFLGHQRDIRISLRLCVRNKYHDNDNIYVSFRMYSSISTMIELPSFFRLRMRHLFSRCTMAPLLPTSSLHLILCIPRQHPLVMNILGRRSILPLLSLLTCSVPATGFALPTCGCSKDRLPFAMSKTRRALSYNPFASMMNDMASSFLSRSVSSCPQVDEALSETDSKNTLLSWPEIRAKLESMMETDEERSFRKNLNYGYGPGSPLQKIRLFDESNKEEDIRVTFFRDSASWCPYWYVRLGSVCADRVFAWISSKLTSVSLIHCYYGPQSKGLAYIGRKAYTISCRKGQYELLRRQTCILSCYATQRTNSRGHY